MIDQCKTHFVFVLTIRAHMLRKKSIWFVQYDKHVATEQYLYNFDPNQNEEVEH